MKNAAKSMLLLGALLSVLAGASDAEAQLIIEEESNHPDYAVDLEPHLVIAPFGSPRGGGTFGFGAGLLVGINLAPEGFIPDVNDSVALGVGLDWVNHSGGQATAGECAKWSGTGDEAICIRVEGGSVAGTYFFLPAVMQWNFYLTEKWSVFGEPGLSLFMNSGKLDPGYRFGVAPVFNLGGRWHFSEAAALTFRVGYPNTSVGVSFYL